MGRSKGKSPLADVESGSEFEADDASSSADSITSEAEPESDDSAPKALIKGKGEKKLVKQQKGSATKAAKSESVVGDSDGSEASSTQSKAAPTGGRKSRKRRSKEAIKASKAKKRQKKAATIEMTELSGFEDVTDNQVKEKDQTWGWRSRTATCLQRVEAIINNAPSSEADTNVAALMGNNIAALIEEGAELYNHKSKPEAKMQKTAERYRIRRCLQPTTTNNHTYATGDVKPELRHPGPHESWSLSLVARGRPELRFMAPTSILVGVNIWDKEVLERMGQHLENIVASRPHGTPDDVATRRLVLRAVFEYEGGNWLQFAAPVWNKDTGLDSLIRFVDIETGEEDVYHHGSRYGMKPSDKYPQLPHSVRFRSGKRGHEQPVPQTVNDLGRMVRETRLPDRDIGRDAALAAFDKKPTRAELQAREEFMQYVQYHLTGYIGRAADFPELIKHMEQEYTGGRAATQHHGSSTLSMQGLLYWRCNRPGSVSFSTSATYARALGMHEPSHGRLFEVPTTNLNWIGALLEVARCTYVRTKDPRKMLLALAKAADAVVELMRAGERPPDSCSCTETSSTTTYHSCDRCLRSTACADLRPDPDGDRVCPMCLPDAQTQESILKKRIDNSVKTSCMQEQRTGRFDKPAEWIDAWIKDCCDDATKQLKGCPPGRFRDMYTSTLKPRGIGFSAMAETVDAVHAWQIRDGALLRHAPGNLAVTQNYANYAKFEWSVGLLHEVAKWLKKKRGIAATQFLQAKVNSLHVQSLAKEERKQKEQRGITEGEQRLNELEWLTGKILDSERLTEKQRDAQQIFPKGYITFDGFSPDEQKLLLRIIHEIVEAAGNSDQLDTGAEDGCPWPRQLGRRPTGWCWATFFSFCLVRWYRLRDCCNRQWETVDTPLTLGLELFYQLNNRKGEYASLFGLPLNLWMKHPFCVSFGHKHHHSQMRTGWPPQPTGLQDRINDDNNLIIESTFENRTKWYWREEEWPLIAAEMENINVPLQWYNPGLVVTSAMLKALRSEAVLVPGLDAEAQGRLDRAEVEFLSAVFKSSTEVNVGAPELPHEAVAGEQSADVSMVDISGAIAIGPSSATADMPLALQEPQKHEFRAVLEEIADEYNKLLQAPVGPSVDVRYVKHQAPKIIDNNGDPRSLPTLDAIRTADGSSNNVRWLDDQMVRFTLHRLKESLPATSTTEIFADPILFHRSIRDPVNPQFEIEDYLEYVYKGNAKLLAAGKKDQIARVLPDLPAGCRHLLTVHFINDNHWVVLEYEANITLKTGDIRVYDSHYNGGAFPEATHIGALLSQIPGGPMERIAWEKPKIVSTPRQANSEDCGLFAIEYIWRQATGSTLPPLMSILGKPALLAFGQRARMRQLVELRDYARSLSASADLGPARPSPGRSKPAHEEVAIRPSRSGDKPALEEQGHDPMADGDESAFGEPKALLQPAMRKPTLSALVRTDTPAWQHGRFPFERSENVTLEQQILRGEKSATQSRSQARNIATGAVEEFRHHGRFTDKFEIPNSSNPSDFEDILMGGTETVQADDSTDHRTILLLELASRRSRINARIETLLGDPSDTNWSKEMALLTKLKEEVEKLAAHVTTGVDVTCVGAGVYEVPSMQEGPVRLNRTLVELFQLDNAIELSGSLDLNYNPWTTRPARPAEQ